MMIARDPATVRIAARILLVQAATTGLIAVLCWAFWGRTQALSALAGGLIGLVANAYMTLATLRSAASAAGALGRLMIGQLVKVALTVSLLVIVARGNWANWPALLFAYAATLVVFWFVPMLHMRSRRVGS
jgi:F0F1-type ATP synthase assembly protein I